MEKKIIKPSVKFINELAELTDMNCHGECYVKVAEWCVQNSEGTNREIFKGLQDAFKGINEVHSTVGILTNELYEARYRIGQVLDSMIYMVFGAATLDAFNKGR